MAIDPGRVKALFQSAIERDDPDDRRAFLDAEAAGDAELRARLDALLAAYDRPPAALEGPLAADLDATNAADATSDHGATEPPPHQGGPDLVDSVVAGRYKIRQEIGEGGMGTVYLADQIQPVRRRVALKLIKRGMDTKNVLARFESERQALALMEHPNIARVLDAGTTDDGRPFFAMELVKGVPITDYCDAHRLDVPARLSLFRQVCQAVQHAHQKGIIHRDLKPTNILVESHDDRPVPKVIDFGLAKATSGMRLGEQTVFTAFGGVAGTPMYMAPEQATFNALDVDTRADIYALGVVLYELLTGTTPITRDAMKQAAIDEMLRVIREVEPPTPSSRVSTSEALPSLAATRGVEPGRLSRLIRGDLDWIAMKALAKERERRYASAVGLAGDIERFLNHEPVSAGPPTAAYRLRKFVRRNRAQVAAAALVLLALVLGVVGTTLGLIEARRQQAIALLHQDRAERRLAQVSKMNVILGSIFRDLDPKNAARDGKPLSAVLGERLDRASAEIEGEATGDPLMVANMQMTLGSSQIGLGYPERATALFARARDTLAAERGPDHPDTLKATSALAAGYNFVGEHERAVKLFEEVLAAQRKKLGVDHPATLATQSNLAVTYADAGRHERARALHEEVLGLQRKKLGPDHINTLQSMNNLANSYADAGRHERARGLYVEALALMRKKLGPDHPETLKVMNNLAVTYADTGRHERARGLREETLALMRKKLGPDHPETLAAMGNLAASDDLAGRHERAVELLEEVLAARRKKLGPDHPGTLMSMSNLAHSYVAAGQGDRGLALIDQAVALARSKLGPDHPETLNHLATQADALESAGELDRASAIRDELIAKLRRSPGEAHPRTLSARMARADLDLARGRLDAALAADRAILDDCRTRLGPDDRLAIAAGLSLARVTEARGDREAAAPLYRAALESARKDPSDLEVLAAALAEAGRSRLSAGDGAAAEPMLREALAIRRAEKPQHWQTAEARSLLGGALLLRKRAAEAAPLLRSGYEAMARSAAAIPAVDRPRLAEALDRLISAGEAAGTSAELASWKAERAKLAAGASQP